MNVEDVQTARQKRYWRRKLTQRCVDCEAGLPDDAECVRCVECTARNLSSQLKYLRTDRAKRRERKRVNVKRRNWRAQGLCVRCGGERDARLICRNCLDTMKLAKLGIAAVCDRPSSPTALRLEIDRYRPLDEQTQNHRVRVLRALWWLSVGGEWSDTHEIFQAAGVDDCGDSRERNSAQVCLGRLVKLGIVERRKTRACDWFDYRITEIGRAEVARYRAGDLPVARGRKRAA